MKISFITTVFNEEKTISLLMKSLISQTLMPDEIIIVDAKSSDKTFSILLDNKKKFYKQFPQINFLIFKEKGNRSIGRNFAIRKANSEIIVATDAGCVLHRDWIKNITEKFKNKNVDVVAGYYKSKAQNYFQKSLTPYILVMPDKVNTDNFLPATRSIAFRKNIWKKIGGFNKLYSHNEDYVFARKLKYSGASIFFAKNAIVYWIPRNTFKEAFIMFFRFAYGDAEAKIFRPKVKLIFVRYIILLVFLVLIMSYKQNLSYVFCFLFIVYFLWAIFKNYKYVGKISAFYYLPILQLLSDSAIILGTILGFSGILNRKN